MEKLLWAPINTTESGRITLIFNTAAQNIDSADLDSINQLIIVKKYDNTIIDLHPGFVKPIQSPPTQFHMTASSSRLTLVCSAFMFEELSHNFQTADEVIAALCFKTRTAMVMALNNHVVTDWQALPLVTNDHFAISIHNVELWLESKNTHRGFDSDLTFRVMNLGEVVIINEIPFTYQTVLNSLNVSNKAAPRYA